jgi:two-component system KDP operon response regulator KdpE
MVGEVIIMNRSLHILVADSDLPVLRFLRSNLEMGGYQVILAADGEEALEKAERELPDVVVLDTMLPRVDGVEVCRRIREWSRVPIIMLSANGDEVNKINCLDLGADDYITKPFGMGEMLARLRVALRHARPEIVTSPSTFISGDLKVNFDRWRVTIDSREVELTPIEFSLLEQLVLNAGKVLTHNMLLQKVWGPEYNGEMHYVHVFVARLRKKLEHDPKKPKYILTKPGVGYYFVNSN